MTNAPLFSRRSFLKTASAAAVGAFGSANAALSKPQWLTSIRDLHLKMTGEPTCWAALDRVKAPGIEMLINEELVCPGLFHPARTYKIGSPDDRKRLRDDLAAHRISVGALAMSNRLDERLEGEIEWMRKAAAAAEDLGVRAIRIDVVPHKMPGDQFLPFAIKACRQLCDVIKDRPIRLGIENHGHYTNDPQFLDKLFDGVGSSQLGLTLDAMNFYWFGHPLPEVYDLCRKYANRTFHTHCKNLNYPAERRDVRRPTGWEYEQHAAPLDQGDLDFRKIAEILRAANYKGDLCLENECLGRFPKDQHVPILQREVALLQSLA